MKYFIILTIQFYWKLIPIAKRRKCIFKKSCSNYVYEITAKEGFFNGIKAFWFRYNNCRSGFEILKDPVDNSTHMILPSKIVIKSDEIAERLLNK